MRKVLFLVELLALTVSLGGPLGLNFFAISLIFSGNCSLTKIKKCFLELNCLKP